MSILEEYGAFKKKLDFPSYKNMLSSPKKIDIKLQYDGLKYCLKQINK